MENGVDLTGIPASCGQAGGREKRIKATGCWYFLSHNKYWELRGRMRISWLGRTGEDRSLFYDIPRCIFNLFTSMILLTDLVIVRSGCDSLETLVWFPEFEICCPPLQTQGKSIQSHFIFPSCALGRPGSSKSSGSGSSSKNELQGRRWQLHWREQQ